jgi:hypothetical protein
MIRDHCEYDGSASVGDISGERSTAQSVVGASLRSRNYVSQRLRSTGFSARHVDETSPANSRTSIVQSSSDHRPNLQSGEKHRHAVARSAGLLGDAGTTADDSENSESFDMATDAWRPPSLQATSRNSANARHYLPGSLGLTNENFGSGVSARGDSKRIQRRASEHDALSHTIQKLMRFSEHDSLNQSSHRERSSGLGHSLHRIAGVKLASSVCRAESFRRLRAPSARFNRDDMSTAETEASVHRNESSVPYFEKICWICEQLNYPFEYADIVGSQFLGLESADPVTHVDGHVPTMDELVEFLALAFICISEFADLNVVVLDDFQWVDAFSWKIFKALCNRSTKMLLVCATRSHDKQALRRLSTAFVTPESRLQSQTIEISLGPLDFTDIRALIVSVLEVNKSSVTDELCSDIFQRTGGLPVFVVQVLENIKRKKTLEVVGGILKWNAEGLRDKVSIVSARNRIVLTMKTLTLVASEIASRVQ